MIFFPRIRTDCMGSPGFHKEEGGNWLGPSFSHKRHNAKHICEHCIICYVLQRGGFLLYTYQSYLVLFTNNLYSGPEKKLASEEQGQGQCQQACILWTHTVGERWLNTAHSSVNSFSGGIPSGSSPSGSTPTLPTSHLSSETQLRNRHGASILTMKELIPATNRAVTTSEQSRGPAQHPVQVLVTTRPATPLIKGIMAKDMEERGVRHLY